MNGRYLLKKLRQFEAISLAVIIFIVAVLALIIAVAVHNANTISAVSDLEISDFGTNNVDLSWNSVKNADGYYIYYSKDKENNFQILAEIDDSELVTYNANDLEQASRYYFYATAFKGKNKKVESSEYQLVAACTRPIQEKISLSSPEWGELKVRWKQNTSADGYQIQYVEGKTNDFSDAETVTVKNADKTTKVIKNLSFDETYSVRVRSYVNFDDKKIKGKWSEIKQVKILEYLYQSDTIDPNKPMVALSFDDGPGYNSASDDILDVLEKYGAKATFFMVGKNAIDHPDNVKRKVKLGMEIGNHTYDHLHYGSDVTVNDIKKATKAIYKVSGQKPTAFRSTGGYTTKLIKKECKKEKMPIFYWSIDTEDWKTRDAKKIYKAVMNNVSDGDIILMHEIYSTTADAVKKIVPALIKKGYQLVTCSELIEYKTGSKPNAGEVYISG